MSVNMGQAVGYLDLDTSKFKSGFKSALNDLKVFQSETATGKDKLAAIGSAATAAGKSLTKGLTVPIAGVGAAAVAVTSKFQSSMSEVGAISQKTGVKASADLVKAADDMGLAYKKNADGTVDELELISAKAKEMGAKTKFSASESAEAFKYMALAGWETGDMLDGIEGIMNLAAASGEDLASVSDIVTDSLTAFGLTAKDSTHFADVLAKTMSSSNTDVAGLGEAFKYVAPVAGAFGYSVEDVSVALGTMANAGIKNSQMGTALRQALVQLTSPSKDAAEYMDKFGISLYDSQGNTKSLMSVMQDLRGTFSMTAMDVEKAAEAAEQGDDAWNNYAKSLNLPANEQEKLTALTKMFGARAMPAMLSIIQASEEDFNKLTEAIGNADGTAEEMSQVMLDNLPGAVTIAKSALEGLGIRIGEVITPTLVKIVKNFTEFISNLTTASDRSVKFAVVLGTVLAAIGPLLMITGSLARNILSLMDAYDKLSKVLASKSVIAFAKSTAAKIADRYATIADTAANMAHKLSLSGMATTVANAASKILTLAAAHKIAAGAALGIVGAVVGLIVYMKKTGTSVEDLKNKVVDTFNNIVQKVPEILNTVSQVAQSIITQIPFLIQEVLPGMISNALSTLSNAISVGMDALKTALPKIADWWANDMPELIAVGSDMIVSLIQGISQTLPEMIQTGTDMAVGFIDEFSAKVPEMVDAGIKMIESLVEGIVQALPQIIEAISAALPNIINSFLTVVISVGNALITALPTILSAVTNILLAIIKAIAQNAPAIIQAGFQLLLALATGIVKAMPQIIVAVLKIALALVEAILSIIGAIIQAGVRIIQALWQGISSWASSLYSKVKDVGKKVWNAIKTGIGNLVNIGKTWIVGLWNGIKSWFAGIRSGVSSFAKNLPKRIKSGIGSLVSTGRQWLSGLWNGIKSWFNSIRSGVRSFASGLPRTVRSAIGNLRSIGANFIAGLWNGMAAKIGGVISNLRSKLSTISTMAKNIFKEHSPSRLMFQYGVWFMEGLENGIDEAYKPLIKGLRDQMEEIVAVYNPMTDYDFGVGESVDRQMINAINGLSTEGIDSSTNNNITQNISIDRAENPEDFAERLAKQLKISMRSL